MPLKFRVTLCSRHHLFIFFYFIFLLHLKISRCYKNRETRENKVLGKILAIRYLLMRSLAAIIAPFNSNCTPVLSIFSKVQALCSLSSPFQGRYLLRLLLTFCCTREKENVVIDRRVEKRQISIILN